MVDVVWRTNVTCNVKVLTWSVADTVWLAVLYLLHLFKAYRYSSRITQNKHLSVIKKSPGRVALLNKSTKSFCAERKSRLYFETQCVASASAHGLADWLPELSASQLFFSLLRHLLSRSCMIPFMPFPTFLLAAVLKKGSFLVQPLRDCSLSSSINIIVLLQHHLAFLPLDCLQPSLLGNSL